MWETPKIDWAFGYVPTYEDLKRIEANLEYLKEVLS